MNDLTITKVSFHRFKKFRDTEIQLKPGVTLLAGGNNSGKTSILQGLAIWEFCKTVLEIEVGKKSLYIGGQRQGVGINDDNFTPINVPSLKHLWTNLRTQRDRNIEPDGYTLWLRIDWAYQTLQRYLTIGLSLVNDRLFIKDKETNVQEEELIPRIAYVPPFAGIVSKEPRHTKAAIRAYIGQGLTGAVLRNIILDLNIANKNRRLEEKITKGGAKLERLRNEDPFERLKSLLQKVFSYGLKIGEFNELYHTSISIDAYRGEIRNKRFQRLHDYTPRDLMVEGSGFLQWLTVLALSLDPEINLVLLDEPDAHLHPSLQEVLLSELNNLANNFNKQILYSTHSPELIKYQSHDRIIDTNNSNPKYLNIREQKVSLLAGIGAEYTPRLSEVKRKKKILFVENESDFKILQICARILGRPFPESFVCWPSSSRHKERKILFLEIKKDLPNLVALSLIDRDDDPIGTVDKNLFDKNRKKSDNKDAFFPRKWRRRHIEGYLLHPDPMARKANLLSPDIVIDYITQKFSLDISGRYIGQNEPQPFLQADAKKIIDDIQKSFFISKYDIANEMKALEIANDVKIIINDIHLLLGP
jgi:predicted ATPase